MYMYIILPLIYRSFILSIINQNTLKNSSFTMSIIITSIISIYSISIHHYSSIYSYFLSIIIIFHSISILYLTLTLSIYSYPQNILILSLNHYTSHQLSSHFIISYLHSISSYEIYHNNSYLLA